MRDSAVKELAPVVGTKAACAAVGQARATFYRWHRQSPSPLGSAPRRHAHSRGR